MMKNIFFIKIFACALFFLASFSTALAAYDIVLSPAKVELTLAGGQESTEYLDLTNRTGQDLSVTVMVDDFALPVALPGRSLKQYIRVDSSPLFLPAGGQAHIPVVIKLPEQIVSGGLYGTVLISAVPRANQPGATKVVTSLGALFFIKVPGPVLESGRMSGAVIADVAKGKSLEIKFENSGDIYLNPYGIINISDYYSKKLVSKIVIDPWFVLPRSTRVRNVDIGRLPPGNYLASLTLNRGYRDALDYIEIPFAVVIPSGSFYPFEVLLVIFVLSLFLKKIKYEN